MEVLTSKNRMSATTFLSLYFSENVITDYYANHNGLAEISESEDQFITYCVPWTLIVLFMLPLLLHFKERINILGTVS